MSNTSKNRFKLISSSSNTVTKSSSPKYLMAHRDELDLKGDHEKAEEIDQLWNGLIQIHF
jgi:ATP-dependent helicase/nuclease subunit B